MNSTATVWPMARCRRPTPNHIKVNGTSLSVPTRLQPHLYLSYGRVGWYPTGRKRLDEPVTLFAIFTAIRIYGPRLGPYLTPGPSLFSRWIWLVVGHESWRRSVSSVVRPTLYTTRMIIFRGWISDLPSGLAVSFCALDCAFGDI